jgi:hypothetical protein
LSAVFGEAVVAVGDPVAPCEAGPDEAVIGAEAVGRDLGRVPGAASMMACSVSFEQLFPIWQRTRPP